MSIEEVGMSFKELIAYNHSETMRWKEWFACNPKDWDLSVGGNAATIRGLVLHIFQAEYGFATRLSRQEGLKEKLEPKTVEELFALHDEAHEMLSQYIDAANEQELRRIDDFPFISGLNSVESQDVGASAVSWHPPSGAGSDGGTPSRHPQRWPP